MKKAISLVFIIFLALNAYAQENLKKIEDEVSRRKEKLSDIDKKIKKGKEKITQAEKEEISTVNQLNIIDKKLSKNRDELSLLNRKSKNLKKEMFTTNTQLKQINQDISQRKKLFNKRIVALYKYQRSGGILRTIFSSHSYLDLSQRTKFIGMILNHDIQIIHQFLEKVSLTKEKKTTLHENQKSMDKVKARILKKKSQINNQKQEKSALLKKIRNEKNTYQTAVKELEKSSRKLQSLIDRLEKELTMGKGHFVPEEGKGFATL
ncbi:MAG: hypothetical protein JRC57_03725, partial [Deltaproteobacteria bacterium]|nr:hypothetical protein [Deltaproteobacteria bacterium]